MDGKDGLIGGWIEWTNGWMGYLKYWLTGLMIRFSIFFLGGGRGGQKLKGTVLVISWEPLVKE